MTEQPSLSAPAATVMDHGKWAVEAGLVVYCKDCQRWDECGGLHVCGQTGSADLATVVALLARRRP